MFINIVITFAGVLVGGVGSVMFLKRIKHFDFEKRKEMAEELLEKSEEEAKEIKKSAEEITKRAKQQLEEEVKEEGERMKKYEETLRSRQSILDKKENRLNKQKLEVAGIEEEIQAKQEAIKKAETEENEKLSQKTGVEKEKMKIEILEKYKKDLEQDKKEQLAKREEYVKENATKIARNVLVNVMQRLSSPTSAETKAVLIKVPKDHIKAKIVGKGAENVMVIENELEVDVIFNDLPNTISVSCYNLVNRRIAQVAIQRLIKVRNDITPQHVKRALEIAREEVEKELYETGKAAVKKIGLEGLSDELIKTIGRLQFRTSYGQNIMKHSMEVAWVATMIGSELGLDVKVCKTAGFLHDLGKAIDQDPDVQGSHDILTKELMEKAGFPEEEVHAAWTHHEAEKPETPEAMAVMAADAVSAGRPGARQESIDKYAERIQALEETGKRFDGVAKSFAISAGRELRVIVDPERVEDAKMVGLAGDIAKTIEEELAYPGKIKVNVIRRTDHIDVAK